MPSSDKQVPSSGQNPSAPPTLSERELEVIKLVAKGATNSEVARALSISVNTVKVHLNNIFNKIGVQSRTEAALYAVRQGWIEVERVNPALVGQGSAINPPLLEPAVSMPAPFAEPSVTTAPQRPRLRTRVVALSLVAGVVLGLLIYPLAYGTPLWQIYIGPRFVNPVPTVVAPAPPRWQLKAPMPTARGAMAVATLNNLIYLMGGQADGRALADVSVYDPATDRWSSRANKPTALHSHGAAVIGGRIYVPGGCDAQDQPSSIMEVYDPVRDSWQSSVSLPKAICHYAISALEGRLYIFGGWDGHDFLSDVFVFDPERGEWSERAALPSPRADAAASVLNDLIYVVGGRDAKGLLDEVLVFDRTHDRASTHAWVRKKPMSHARAGPGLVSLAGDLYAMGGGWSSALIENERYDVTSDSWANFESTRELLWRVGAAAALAKRFYVMGGWNGSASAVVQEYTALYDYFLPIPPPSQ